MKFRRLVEYFEDLEKVTSGNAIRAILADLFKKVSSNEIDKVVYLVLGRICPEYSDIVIGMADKMVIKSIALSSNKDVSKVFESYQTLGDIGLTAHEHVKSVGGELSVNDVFNELNNIAKVSGDGSLGLKLRMLSGLFAKSSKDEAKYVARIVLGTLRLGVATMSVLDALSIAFTGNKESKDKIERAFDLCTDSGYVAKVIATSGVKGLDKVGVNIGSPIKMMLCQRVKSLDEIHNVILGTLTIEEKYDGERLQIHFDGKNVKIFSRRLDDITSQFPDVVRYVKKNIKANSYIIEGEAVACKNGVLQEFQLLMRRRRKYDVEKYVSQIPVCVFLFDLLYLNGRTYLNKSYPERRKALEKVARESENIKLAVQVVTDKSEIVLDFFEKSLLRNCEGIIAKSMAEDSFYKAGVRGWQWIKWKKDYGSMVDTIDVVIVGAFLGKGRRKGMYGALLCAIYNPKNGQFETLTKLGTGFSDDVLKNMSKQFEKFVVLEKPHNVASKFKADVWFKPDVVSEIAGAEITKSPIHTAGGGFALRFPRFIRWRNDKKPEDTTLFSEIKKMIKK